MRNTIISTAFAVLALAASTSAAAAGERTVTIHAGDFNINSEAGMAALQDRIDDAVETVCPIRHVRPLDDFRAARRCQARAHDDAQEQLQQLRRGTVEILVIRADGDRARNQ